MNGHEFEQRVRRLARDRGVYVSYMSHGKGSHGRLYLGDRFTTLKDRKKEIGKGLLQEHLVPVEPLVATKLALRSAMKQLGVSNVALAQRLGISEGAVRRLVNPDHASRLDGVVAALSCLGRRLVIEDLVAA
jgi:pyruvate/2-oxoglutarate dehydrogenase complex dihydrolipoamide acyltransferase (E2) component